jgi:hypothetical protein
MKHPMHMTPASASELEYEVVSDDLRAYLTRRLRDDTRDDDPAIELGRRNAVVNMSRTITGDSIYVLTPDHMGDYYAQEIIWHNGQVELVFRRLSSVELADFLAELVAYDYMDQSDINRALKRAGASFRIESAGFGDKDVPSVTVLSAADVEQSAQAADAHPNIRVLVTRMDAALERQDYAGVLHASASVFETLAKLVVGLPTLENQTLKAFFSRYRKDSLLPDELLDYIRAVYDARSTTPLAGHGGTCQPSIGLEQATVIAEMTKAFVKIERKLALDCNVPAVT